MGKAPIIAIDGPAGSGKSAVAALVADRLGFACLDTGQMYRAVALKALRAGLGFSNPEALAILAEKTEFVLQPREGQWVLLVDGEDLTTFLSQPEVDQGSSLVAVVPGVRSALVRAQRRMAEAGGIVVAGRDIQTVVFPEAQVKVFLAASPAVRASRRALQRGMQVEEQQLQQIAAEIERRDQRDATRTNAPLKAAEDAVVIDTDPLTAEQVADKIIALVRARSG